MEKIRFGPIRFIPDDNKGKYPYRPSNFIVRC